MEENIVRNKIKGKSLLGSSAGLIAAVIIIALFVLTATFFKSVVFGILLAYLFLPLQGWYKNCFLQNKLIKYTTMLASSSFSPITKPLNAIKNKAFRFFNFPDKTQSLTEIEKTEQKLVAKSCNLTTATVLIIFVFALAGIIWLSTSYLTSATRSISSWAQKTTTDYENHLKTESIASPTENSSNDSSSRQFLKAISYKLEEAKPRIERFKVIRFIKKFLEDNLSNPDNIRMLIANVYKKTEGFFSYTAGAIGTLFFIILNTVFTFFFFAFFLNKLAAFRSKVGKKNTPGQCLTNALLSSAWFPNTGESTKERSTEILDNILHRLKIWIRGYCIIIVIEACFYITSFTLIGVPFGLILGLIAGCTILLPYIGPMLSALLTIIICLTLGDMSMIQILLVVLSYIFMTGILDQLFIYPAVVGGSLGLNELETIVVVLLGGMLFGITGMIFAVPATSIIKYLIPEIYKLIEDKQGGFHEQQSKEPNL